ncbi:MAG: hypothetical protein GWP08_04600, partial [Nitrospiraceae bacterium]|nr:hypothetical protein [Nitrospiraceae bacterium]
MSRELIYTSAPRGLAPNSRGFSTVAVSAGMSRQFRMALEALCGYEFRFNVSDPQAHLNPTNFAHTVIAAGAQKSSVLSRIGANGTDYSGRSNKIAHHFLLAESEKLSEGPAAMLEAMSAAGLFRTEWEGEPRELGDSPLAQLADSIVPGRGGGWANVAGDRGWAGQLAKAFHENPKMPAFVVFEPGTNLLPLFVESMAVLPPAERWQVGFATYYSVLPSGCTYHWRGVLAGSKAAAEARRFPNATVIDLTKPLPAVPDNPYTAAARQGQVVASETPASARPSQEKPSKHVERAAALATPREQGSGVVLSGYSPTDLAATEAKTRPLSAFKPRKKVTTTTLLVAAVVVLAIGTGVSVAMLLMAQSSHELRIKELQGDIASKNDVLADQKSKIEEVQREMAEKEKLLAAARVRVEESRRPDPPQKVTDVEPRGKENNQDTQASKPTPNGKGNNGGDGATPEDASDKPADQGRSLRIIPRNEIAGMGRELWKGFHGESEAAKDVKGTIAGFADIPQAERQHYQWQPSDAPGSVRIIEVKSISTGDWIPFVECSVLESSGKVQLGYRRMNNTNKEKYDILFHRFVLEVVDEASGTVYQCPMAFRLPQYVGLELGYKKPSGEGVLLWGSDSENLDEPTRLAGPLQWRLGPDTSPASEELCIPLGLKDNGTDVFIEAVFERPSGAGPRLVMVDLKLRNFVESVRVDI